MQEEEWFEFDSDLTLGPGPHRRATFYADEDIPEALVEEMRRNGLKVRSAREAGRGGRDDKDQAAFCARKGWVLVTKDQGFWNERRFPTQRTSPGMIILAGDGEAELTEAMALAWVLFARHYPGDWWHGVKARAAPGLLRIRLRDFAGRVVEYDFKLSSDGRLMVREGSRNPPV